MILHGNTTTLHHITNNTMILHSNTTTHQNNNKKTKIMQKHQNKGHQKKNAENVKKRNICNINEIKCQTPKKHDINKKDLTHRTKTTR